MSLFYSHSQRGLKFSVPEKSIHGMKIKIVVLINLCMQHVNYFLFIFFFGKKYVEVVIVGCFLFGDVLLFQ